MLKLGVRLIILNVFFLFFCAGCVGVFSLPFFLSGVCGFLLHICSSLFWVCWCFFYVFLFLIFGLGVWFIFYILFLYLFGFWVCGCWKIFPDESFAVCSARCSVWSAARENISSKLLQFVSIFAAAWVSASCEILLRTKQQKMRK